MTLFDRLDRLKNVAKDFEDVRKFRTTQCELEIKIDAHLQRLKCKQTVIDYMMFIRMVNRNQISSMEKTSVIDILHESRKYLERMQELYDKTVDIDCVELQKLIESTPQSVTKCESKNSASVTPMNSQSYMAKTMGRINLYNSFVSPRCAYIGAFT
jgi:hypothetical protein